LFLTKRWDWWLEWSSTAVLLVGVALTAFNIYPSNIYLSFIGNLMWMATGIVWKKWSLVVVEAIICAIYIVGFIRYVIG